jgi:hypothetical protein
MAQPLKANAIHLARLLGSSGLQLQPVYSVPTDVGCNLVARWIIPLVGGQTELRWKVTCGRRYRALLKGAGNDR